jgi:ribose transport system permease protein
LLKNVPVILFLAVFVGFALSASQFLQAANLVNILIQSSSAIIVATGMTFVLLTAGIDLSVGSIMFVTAAIAGKILLGDGTLTLALVAALLAGLIYGLLNSVFIARLGMMAFIVTLASLYLGRGIGLWITETRAMNLPESLLQIGTARLFGIVPVPVIVAAVVVAVAHLTLTSTPYGRQVYAVGYDKETAIKGGIKVKLILASVYWISAGCAVVGGIVSLAQLGAVSPTFGSQREFAAIAAAVLGGTSLFGGKGGVLPGTVLGAVLIQMIENGLVIINANPYIYPLVTGGIIFLAVLLDSLRHRKTARLRKRQIRFDRAQESMRSPKLTGGC